MASLTNPYFLKTSGIEQNLIESLQIEAIQVMGRTLYYLPRDLQVASLILNEDIISKFSLAIPIEMYMEDAMGFQGDREIFSKFGLQIQNSYKLVVSQKRWETEVKSLFDGDVTNQEASFIKANYIRPHEGDLIYDPLTKFLMEITFVDHDATFYQIGKNYNYTLSCEAFNYSSEEFSTGIEDIDVLNELTDDIVYGQLMTEEDGLLMMESCGDSLLQENDGEESDNFVYGVEFDGVAENVPENPFA